MSDQVSTQLADVLGARLVVVTGKGGTGRTTVAAALALAAARSGRRAIVCEVAGQARVPGLFGRPAPKPGAEEQLGASLWATTIDPTAALEEWLGQQMPGRLVHLLARSGAFAAFTGAAPGARELVTITKAWELGEPRRWRADAHPYDTVVLDAPASGHGVGLLRTPRTYAEIARIGPIATQARAVEAALADPARCAVVAVTLPGELPVSETLELDAWLRARAGRGLDAIVANGVWPRRLSQQEAARVAEHAGEMPRPAGRAAASAARRVGGQRRQLARLRRAVTAPIQHLPYVFTPRLVLADVTAFAHHLGGGRPHP